MKAAGIERVGPTGQKGMFHTFRHTFAKRALESGRQITWLSRHPRPFVAERHERGLWALGAC
jgi:integrase